MIQAQTSEGNWTDVPHSFFLAHSKTFSHGLIDLSFEKGHYFPTLWGSARRYERRLTSGTCPAAPERDFVPEIDPEHWFRLDIPEERAARIEKLSKFIRAHHRNMLRMTEQFGRHFFYFRFHIHPSNWWLYSDFNRLDMKSIKAYRLVTHSVCLKMKDGRLEEREIKRSVYQFDVS
jgi:hypothetical protein